MEPSLTTSMIYANNKSKDKHYLKTRHHLLPNFRNSYEMRGTTHIEPLSLFFFLSLPFLQNEKVLPKTTNFSLLYLSPPQYQLPLNFLHSQHRNPLHQSRNHSTPSTPFFFFSFFLPLPRIFSPSPSPIWLLLTFSPFFFSPFLLFHLLPFFLLVHPPSSVCFFFLFFFYPPLILLYCFFSKKNFPLPMF